jgi:hypothetical protein
MVFVKNIIKRISWLSSQLLVFLNCHHVVIQIELFVLLRWDVHLTLSIALQLVKAILGLMGVHCLVHRLSPLNRVRPQVLLRCVSVLDPVVLFFSVHCLVDWALARLLGSMLNDPQFLNQISFNEPYSLLLLLDLFHLSPISSHQLCILIPQLKSLILESLFFDFVLLETIVRPLSLLHGLNLEISQLHSHLLLLFRNDPLLFKHLFLHLHFTLDNTFLLLS